MLFNKSSYFFGGLIIVKKKSRASLLRIKCRVEKGWELGNENVVKLASGIPHSSRTVNSAMQMLEGIPVHNF